MTDGQMFALGAICGALVVLLAWWVWSVRLPSIDKLREQETDRAERAAMDAANRVEQQQLALDHAVAELSMYENRVERLTNKEIV